MTYDFDDVSDERRRTMQAIESEGTGPEQKAAAALDELGVDYEEQVRVGRFKPDFIVEGRFVLQVLGCYWHGCPCQRGMDEVETNEDYWTPKLRDNKERDHRRRKAFLTEHGFEGVGWVWEHENIPARVAAFCRHWGVIDD